MEKGLSLSDIVTYVHELFLQARFSPQVPREFRCAKSIVSFQNGFLLFCICKVTGHVLEKLSDLEYRLTFGVNERIQLAAFVGVFQLAQEMVLMEDAKLQK